MSRYRRTFDPDVSDAEFGEIHDAWHDTRPTRADVDDVQQPYVHHRPDHEAGCSCLLCALQARVDKAMTKENQ